jgi:hypothetical protein
VKESRLKWDQQVSHTTQEPNGGLKLARLLFSWCRQEKPTRRAQVTVTPSFVAHIGLVPVPHCSTGPVPVVAPHQGIIIGVGVGVGGVLGVGLKRAS